MFIIMWKSIQNSKAEADNVPVMWAGTAMKTGVIQGLTRINKMYQKKKKKSSGIRNIFQQIS